MANFGTNLGASMETFFGLSGLGDMMATCYSKLSRNYRMGLKIAQGKSVEEAKREINQTIEGLETTRSIARIAEERNIKAPIARIVNQVICGQAPTNAGVRIVGTAIPVLRCRRYTRPVGNATLNYAGSVNATHSPRISSSCFCRPLVVKPSTTYSRCFWMIPEQRSVAAWFECSGDVGGQVPEDPRCDVGEGLCRTRRWARSRPAVYHDGTSTRSSRLARAIFLRDAVTACSSLSMATQPAAPRRKAAMVKMPDPLPRSSSRLAGQGQLFQHSQ